MNAPAKRRMVLGGVFALLFLPLGLALSGAVSFNTRNRNNGSLISSGERREYLLYVPKHLDRTKRSALVISMHGGAVWPTVQMEMSQWNKVADKHGFIVVYPSGTGLARQKVWRAGQGASGPRDVRFISELIDALKEAYNIDTSRVYADGLSNGAGMAFRLSCELSDRIAAVGMVSSAIFLPWERCGEHRPVPVIAFHGTADELTRYHGGEVWLAPKHSFPDIPTWTATLSKRNGCGPKPIETVVTKDVTRTEFRNCRADAAVQLYTIHGGGHTWPGGGLLPEWFVGATTRSIDASSLMWEFFKAHPMPSVRTN